MKEIISLCVGQAGVQIGDTCNRLFAEESGITHDGLLSEEATKSTEPNTTDIFFHEDSTGRFRPRSLLLDTEPLVIDDVLRSSNGGFYGSKQVVYGE